MARTTPVKVQEIIETDAEISLKPFIGAASSLVDKVETNDTGSILSAADLAVIETWLAAHFYAIRDQQYQSKSTQGASGTFQGQTGSALEGTQYGQMAMTLDVTGYLSKLNQQTKNGPIKARAIWLGTEYD